MKAEKYFDSNNAETYTFDITPYSYQQEILDKLEAERTVRGQYRNLVVAATGTGKTVISAFDYKRFRKQNPNQPCRLLFIAHREEILKQSMYTFRGVLKDQNFGEMFVGTYVPESIDNLFMSIQTFNSQDFTSKTCFENLANMISEFEKVNTYSKYRTDLEEFIKESQFEDFYTDDRETVFVSTIHKSKGREFDSVWLLLNHTVLRDDAERRKLYVGMTRAKDNLYVHCNNGIFDTYQISGVDQFVDEEQYPKPQEITLQLTHKDVVLDFFKDKKEIIFKLHSGMPLSIKDEFLYAELDGRTVKVAKLSKARMLELENLSAKEQALIRECREELAVTLSVGDVFMDVIHEYPDITVHLTLFNATIAEGIPQKLEHNDIRWITPSEIPNYAFCPADEEILKKIIEVCK